MNRPGSCLGSVWGRVAGGDRTPDHPHLRRATSSRPPRRRPPPRPPRWRPRWRRRAGSPLHSDRGSDCPSGAAVQRSETPTASSRTGPRGRRSHLRLHLLLGQSLGDWPRSSRRSAWCNGRGGRSGIAPSPANPAYGNPGAGPRGGGPMRWRRTPRCHPMPTSYGRQTGWYRTPQGAGAARKTGTWGAMSYARPRCPLGARRT